MSDPIRITSSDLVSSEVESYLETQEYLRRDVGELEPQSWFVRIVYSSWFYLAVCCGIGAFLGWAVLEPFMDDNEVGEDTVPIGFIMLFPTVAACIGLFLGAAEGIMCRNLMRAVVSGAVGLGVGFGGGLVALIPTGIVFTVMKGVALAINPQLETELSGFGLLVFMMGRGTAWAIVSIPAGLGQGIALREMKVVVNGVVGAVLGGLLGGLLFDPISFIWTSADGQATYSRAIGLVCIGVLVGLFVGLVEGWTKTAWLIMRKGPLAGKQFIMFKDTTTLGSSPKAEIYLFKDDAIEPKHAVIYNRGGRFEIEDRDTPDGTYVNGIPIKRQMLQHGDQIVMGQTVLEFALKEARH